MRDSQPLAQVVKVLVVVLLRGVIPVVHQPRTRLAGRVSRNLVSVVVPWAVVTVGVIAVRTIFVGVEIGVITRIILVAGAVV